MPGGYRAGGNRGGGRYGGYQQGGRNSFQGYRGDSRGRGGGRGGNYRGGSARNAGVQVPHDIKGHSPQRVTISRGTLANKIPNML